MEAKQIIETHRIDYTLLLLYAILVGIGWLMLYTVGHKGGYTSEWSDFLLKTAVGKQITCTGIALCLFLVLLEVKVSFWQQYAYVIYGLGICLLIIVLFLFMGSHTHSWIRLGWFWFQPAEIAKIGTCLALSRFLARAEPNVRSILNQFKIAGFILFPVWWIFLQPDISTCYLFFALWIVLFRAGFSGMPVFLGFLLSAVVILSLLYSAETVFYILSFFSIAFLIQPIRKKQVRMILLTIGMFLLSSIVMDKTQFIYKRQFKPHQRERVNIWLHPEKCDPRGMVYNLNYSKIAIGSGGLLGRGFLQGILVQTGRIPEVSTDFIFCSIGEAFGFMGSFSIITLFCIFLIRLIQIAERQSDTFARYYAYSVASFFFAPFLINIGMTMGLLPILGVSLPFISAGGSALIGFTILLAILLKLDSQRISE